MTAVFLAAVLSSGTTAQAETKPFVQEVNQPFSGSQSPDDARVAALAKAKMEVLEKAGTYMASVSVVENHVLTRDEITAVAAGILKTEIVSQQNYATEKGFGIILVTRVEVNTDSLVEKMQLLLKDRTIVQKYNEIQQREKELLAIIRDLEQRNRELKTRSQAVASVDEKEIMKQLGSTIRALPASEWNRKAVALWHEGKYTNPSKALEFLDESIRLDPHNPTAYNNRGVAYFGLGVPRKAIEDYSQAILLDPGYTAAYNNRGIAHFHLQKYQDALKDFNQVIRHKPDMVEAYFNRGATYKNLFQYRLALEDFGRVRSLDPDYAEDLDSKGSILIGMNEVEHLCRKARMACNLGLCRALDFLRQKKFCDQ